MSGGLGRLAAPPRGLRGHSEPWGDVRKSIDAPNGMLREGLGRLRSEFFSSLLGFAIKTTLPCYLLFSGTAGIVFS